MRDALKLLYAKPCTCVSCGDCGGSGNIWINSDGAGRFIGMGHWDDLSELEPCESCRGGIIETCERCMEIEELEQQLDEMEQRRTA